MRGSTVIMIVIVNPLPKFNECLDHHYYASIIGQEINCDEEFGMK